jgi:hypothetical protein
VGAVIRSAFLALLLLSPAALAKNAAPGSEEAARALLSEFLKPGADAAALSAKLKPSKADYGAVFDADAAAKAEAAYGPVWDRGQMVIKGSPDQTEVKLARATTDELKMGTGAASAFPGGYKTAASFMKPGLTVYAFKFVKPGESLGMAFDGLVFVNGHFAIFPKPWRFLK